MHTQIETKLNDSKPTIISQFDSTQDVSTLIKKTKNKRGAYINYAHSTGERDSSLREPSSDDWVSTKSMNEWLKILDADGSNPLVVNTLQELRRFTKKYRFDWQTIEHKRVRKFANSGTRLHRERLYSGRAHKAYSSKRREHVETESGNVCVLMSSSMSWDTDGEQLRRAGFACYQLVSALESAGKSVDVWVMNLSLNAYYGFQKKNQKGETIKTMAHSAVMHRLKSPRIRGTLATYLPVCFPDYLRRCIFRIEEYTANSMKGSMGFGYGTATRPGDDEGQALIKAWASQNHIDTDYLLITPEPSSPVLNSTRATQEWLNDTLASI